MKRIAIILFLTLALSSAAFAASHYWQLGVGSYGASAGTEDTCAGFTDLDRARMDWLFVCLGNERTDATILNRYFKLNPKLKVVVRLWPITNLGQKENRHQATFLDYRYAAGVKEKLLQETSRQIRSILDGNDYPENVVGFTFLEELPMHFTGEELTSTDPNRLPWALKQYQQQIEAERGKPLVWDADSRRWWGQQFVKVVNEINAYIKKESGGKLVFVYFQTNHTILDYYPDGTDLQSVNLLPFHYKDVIKPGVADGFFVYPNSPQIFKRYLDIATRNNWLFFSQVAHPGTMRLCNWEEQLRLAQTKAPQNLGYFFYCDGHCKTSAWNDDPTIPADDNFRPASIPSHFRRHTAQRGVGVDIVKRHLVPTLQLEYDTGNTRAGDFVFFNLMIHNVRNESWHLDERDAILKRARVTIHTPTQFPLARLESFPATVELGDITPDGVSTIMWWSKARDAARMGPGDPVKVVLEADNCPPLTLSQETPRSIIEPPRFREVRRAGERWIHSAYHIKSDNELPTIITFQCLRDTATNPALTINNSKFVWQGCLTNGQTLVVGPARKVVLKDPSNADPRDVSDRLGGNGARLHGYRLNYVTYTDDDVPSPSSKLKITIEPQTPK